MRVLRGATQVIERCRPALFIEVDDAALRKQGSTAQELFSYLAGLGYRAYRLRRFGAPVTVATSDIEVGSYQDLLFLNERAPANPKVP
jgi:hypothetical protein